MTSSAMRRALRRARDGVTLDQTEAEVLLGARDDDLDDLLATASRVRDQGLADAGRPGVVTYSRKVFIPLTRLCRDRCHYCTFATTPNRVDAPFLSPDEVLAIATQGAALGCKEALFTLGDRPGGPLAGSARMARRARLRLDARLRARDGDPRARAHRSAAAPEPRRDVVGRTAAAQAGRSVDGDDARDNLASVVRRPARCALRITRQGS